MSCYLQDVSRFKSPTLSDFFTKKYCSGIDIFRVTFDASRDLEISYNLLNLPMRAVDANDDEVLADVVYLADGTKLAEIVPGEDGLLYIGDVVFNRFSDGTYSFESAPFSMGRIEGNSNDFYPFGMRREYPAQSAAPVTRYLYNGKESLISVSPDILDFGARYYNPAICRWTSIDPIAEKYYSITPYNYCSNDPVNFLDPDGREIKVNGTPTFQGKFNQARNYMRKCGTYDNLQYLEDTQKVVCIIKESRTNRYICYRYKQALPEMPYFCNILTEIQWNPDEIYEDPSLTWTSSVDALLHEGTHAKHHIENPEQYYKDTNTPDAEFGDVEERKTIEEENKNAIKHGEVEPGQKVRTSHTCKTHYSAIDTTPEQQAAACKDHNDIILGR